MPGTSAESDHSPHFAYEAIDVRSTALKTKPWFTDSASSGLDSYAWRRLCSSFGRFSADLCSSVAAVTRRLCSSYVDPLCLRALLSCRLIALNKLYLGSVPLAWARLVGVSLARQSSLF